MEEKQVIGMEAACWKCEKVWNISTLPAGATSVKCDCGGFVVTPSGKAMMRPIYDVFDSRAPLLEVGDNETPEVTPNRIILPGDEGFKA